MRSWISSTQELRPLIAAAWAARRGPTRRLYGHSLAGLFTLHGAVQPAPELSRNYVRQ